MTMKVHETQQELVASVAAEIADFIRDCEEVFRLVVTGGGLGIATIAALGRQEFDRKKLRIVFCDERYVDNDQEDRNEHQALEAWPGISDCQFIRFPAPDGSALAAAEDFSEVLKQTYETSSSDGTLFDLVLLGVGEDGHVASLFPNKENSKSWVVAEIDSPKPPKQRLSLSFEVLNRATKVWFVVGGQAKAEIVNKLNQGADLPANKVKGFEETTWWVDRALSDAL
ncbi:MAG: 6-phosphogluconolactonase [Actinobacteria bacterium]|uniref:Unannotated protein n=1 Tax=freshwater metagenome TaxID=449393 RepID=A0A6J6BHU8_9ZZZZ|nr:6-phosphogluconolactonase [Actinomycetota bacterium]MTA89381.1 6-phosphogluconolactonase [Actinomycetota bacterium]